MKSLSTFFYLLTAFLVTVVVKSAPLLQSQERDDGMDLMARSSPKKTVLGCFTISLPKFSRNRDDDLSDGYSDKDGGFYCSNKKIEENVTDVDEEVYEKARRSYHRGGNWMKNSWMEGEGEPSLNSESPEYVRKGEAEEIEDLTKLLSEQNTLEESVPIHGAPGGSRRHRSRNPTRPPRSEPRKDKKITGEASKGPRQH